MRIDASTPRPRPALRRSAWQPPSMLYAGLMREQLAETLGEVFWTDLRAHVARDAVILVAADLDLLDVGEAVASNDTTAVEAWITAGKLTKPTAEELARWPLQADLRFVSLVVAPFVLVRRPPSPPPS